MSIPSKPLLILGAGILGRIAQQIFESNEMIVYGFLDDRIALQKKQIGGIQVLGKIKDKTFLNWLTKGNCLPFAALDDIQEQAKCLRQLKQVPDIFWANAIAQDVYLPKDLRLGEGNLIEGGTCIAPDVIISSFVRVGQQVLFGAGSVIHDFVEIGAGSLIGRNACIEEGVRLGYRVTIEDHVVVGKEAVIPSGMVVRTDVPEHMVLGPSSDSFLA